MAMLPVMLEQDRTQAGWSVGQTAWRLGVSLREYRELEAGTRSPGFETWDRIWKLFGCLSYFRLRTRMTTTTMMTMRTSDPPVRRLSSPEFHLLFYPRSPLGILAWDSETVQLPEDVSGVPVELLGRFRC